MCRFVLYMGPEISLDVLTTRPTNSIIHQSFRSNLRREPLNGDGFGISWYVPSVSEEPARFRSIQPAWNNANLHQLARTCKGPVIMAHVRAASSGSAVSEANCHPFTAGRIAFMHNGSIEGFTSLKRKFSNRLSDESYDSIQGTTDSEQMFGIFRDHLASMSDDNNTETEKMADALEATISDVVSETNEAGANSKSTLNLAVTDGTCAVVSRFASGAAECPSLFVAQGERCLCENNVCRMERSNRQPSSVMVASEPLDDDPVWKSVPENHMVLIDPELTIQLRPIGAGKKISGIGS